MLRGLLGAVLSRARGSQQQRRACERRTDGFPDGHCASLQAFWSNRISVVSIGSTPNSHGQFAALKLNPRPSLAPVIGTTRLLRKPKNSGDPAAVNPTTPPIDARSVLDFLRQRGVQEPAAFGQVVERSLQFLHVFARQSALRSRHCARRTGALTFGTLRSFPAHSPAQQWQVQRGCAFGRHGLLDCAILLGRLAGRLRRPRLPDILHEAHTLLAQQTLDATDGVAFAIEKMTDAAQKIEVVRAIVAASAATLHRPDLAEAAFPEPQHVLRNIELLRHFADGPECVRCLVHRRSAPSAVNYAIFVSRNRR